MAASAYEKLGASAGKEEVHKAVAGTDAGLFPGAFCRVAADVLGGDPEWCCALHADGAGTKVLVAYLLFRETGNAAWFRGIAQDSLVMNLDDLVCIGATERFVLSNTIGRNSFHVPGSVLGEIITGYDDCIHMLAKHGITIVATGGETADLVDTVRTLVVDSTLVTRLRRSEVVDNANISPGDAIVGLSSTGQANYESRPNSGIASNGLTLARHALLQRRYAEKYPESVAPEIDPALAYRGPFALDDRPEGLGMTVGEALLAPTRTYAPVVRQLLDRLGGDVHGMVHDTGGGQTKCQNFGRGIRYRKDALFPCPPLFRLIAEHGQVAWQEMYQTFNMGHRLEVMVPEVRAPEVVQIARAFGIEARIVGTCEPAASNSVLLQTEFGAFEYGSRPG